MKKYLSYIAALKDMDREYARERMCAVLETMELAAVSDAKIKTLSGNETAFDDRAGAAG